MNDWKDQAVHKAKEKIEQEGLKFIPGQQFTREFIMSNDEFLTEVNVEEVDGDDLEEFIQKKVDELEEFISSHHAEQFQIIDGHRWLSKSIMAKEVKNRSQVETRATVDKKALERLHKTANSWASEDAHEANKTIDLLSQDGDELEAKKLALKLLKYAKREQKSARELINIREKLATLSESLGTKDTTEHYYNLAEIEWKNEQFSDAQVHFEKAVETGEEYYKELVKAGKDARKDREIFDRTLSLVYRRARKFAREEGNSKTVSHLYVKECKLQCRNEKKFSKRLARQVYGITANHGESPWRVALWGITSILIFALLYCWINAELPNPASGGNKFCKGIAECTYYSTVTFSTLGYGELVPTAPAARFIASVQALLGLIITSLFIATFFKRYSRE